MAILTLEIIILFSIVSFFLYKGNLIGPWFIACLAILASYVIVLLNYEKWDVSIHPEFALCIAVVCASWGAGVIVLRCLVREPLYYSVSSQGAVLALMQNDRLINLIQARYPYRLLALLSVALTGVYVFLVIDIGPINSLSSFQSALRAIYENGTGENFLGTQIRMAVISLGYISVHRILLLTLGDKAQIRPKMPYLVIPVAMLLICVLIFTDRNIFLRFTLYSIFLYIMFNQCQSSEPGAFFKLFIKITCMGAIILFVFFLYGLSKQYSSDLFGSLSIYGGSGLNNLNIWLNSFDGPFTNGNNTFSSFQHTLAVLGFGDGSNLSWNKEPYLFITPSGYLYESNVYSAFMDYYSDFGYLGLFVIPFCVGVFFELLYVFASRKRYGLAWVLYAFFLYAPVYMPIAEFFLTRLHFYFAYEIFWIVLLYSIVYGIVRIRQADKVFAVEKKR